MEASKLSMLIQCNSNLDFNRSLGFDSRFLAMLLNRFTEALKQIITNLFTPYGCFLSMRILTNGHTL